MKISALRLFNVKRFAGRGVAIEGIGSGVNVLCAANEFGKSTSFEALHALFFQPHSGTPGDVQRLRPYSGGSPLVEADIDTPDGRFRITKQFYGGRSARVVDLATGRLVAQADEAENFIASQIRGGAGGPAGLLWVRQGVTGIEKRSKSEEEGDKQVRESLLTSVQGEVEAITGGRRMKDIMAGCAEELARLVTATGRPKTGERYAAAIDERDRLTAEEARLGREVAALRDALDRRAAAGRRLAELDAADGKAERQRAVSAAQAAYDAARAQGEALKTAEAELKLVREQRAAAARDLQAFREALARARDLEARLAAALRQRGEATGIRRDAMAAIAAARAEADAAEAAEQEARDLLARLDAALRAREAAQRLAELSERLRDAEATRRSIEEGEAVEVLLRVPAAAVEELQQLDVDIAKLRAIAQAGRPSVAVSYAAGADAVSLDGVPLAEADEHAYDGQAQLLVPGVGTITLRSPRPSRDDGGLEKAEERRRVLLASIGVEDLAAARARQVRAQQAEADLRALNGRLVQLAPDGLAALREAVAARSTTNADQATAEGDPAAARVAHGEADARRRQARLALREAEPLRASADAAFVAAETALASLQGERSHVDAILGPEAERPVREAAMAAALAELEVRLAAADANASTLRDAAADLDTAAASLQRVRSVEAAAEREANALRESVAGLNAEIRAGSDVAVEEKWHECAEALAAASARVDGFAREVAVLNRLQAALEGARSQAQELYLKPVMTELRPLLGLLFDDVSITFDEKTLLPQTIRRNGQEEDVERLSGGMREQLSVLTRLAFARLLARDGRPAPVILDDALVYSDDDRIEKMFDALHRQARDQQIIVFSCRQRAFQRLGGNVLEMVDWQP